jgi:hypothetical protein
MKDPLAVEIFNFDKKNKVKKTGGEIIAACHTVLGEMAARDRRLTARLLKTYRRGEKFTPCLAVIGNNGMVDDNDPKTVYIRPTLRNYGQGFNPGDEYERIIVASGLVTTMAYDDKESIYNPTEQAIMTVRDVRQALVAKLGGPKLLERRPKCVLCNQWVAEVNESSEQFYCPTHGPYPPVWLAVDDSPPPQTPPAGSPALLPDNGPGPRVMAASGTRVA